MHRKHPPRPTIRLLTDDTVTDPFQENSPMPTVQTTAPNLTFTTRGITVPTVEALVAELALHRDARDHADEEMEWDDEVMFYGRPKIRITAVIEDDEDGQLEYVEVPISTFAWDHTVWSLVAAAEVARGFKGRVHVVQDVLTFVPDEEEESEEDEDNTEDGAYLADIGFDVLIADYLTEEARAFIEGDEAGEDEDDGEE